MVAPKKGLIDFEINEGAVSVPLGWQDISVLATWNNGNTQANITTSEVELTLDAARAVRQHVADGMLGGVGIFEGLPCKLNVNNGYGQVIAFDGYANLTNSYKDSERRNRVYITLEKKDGLNSLNQRLEALSYGYLESLGVYSDSDYITVLYVVEKMDNGTEIIVAAITLFIMLQELYNTTNETTKQIIDTAALFAILPLGSAGAIIKSVGTAALLIVYNAIMLAAVINLANNLFASMISPIRKHKGIKLEKLLSKVSQHLGYGFETDIADLTQIVYIPANTQIDKFGNDGFISIPRGTKKGIPAESDEGYRCIDMFNILMKAFNARFAIVDGVVQFRHVDSDYWTRQADYIIPAVDEISVGYNTDELMANRLVSFMTDPTDGYTLENYTGTVCETITDAITVVNADAKYLKGLDDIRLPWALGTEKTKLNALEVMLKGLGKTIDNLTGILGGGTNFSGKIENRIGMLKVTSNNTTKGKLLLCAADGRLIRNHREKLSAVTIEQYYQYSKSFIVNEFRAQKLKFEGVRIPFGFNDYLKLIENSNCYDSQGREAIITKLEYNISSDTAVIDYQVRQPYTNNLKETLIIP